MYKEYKAYNETFLIDPFYNYTKYLFYNRTFYKHATYIFTYKTDNNTYSF